MNTTRIAAIGVIALSLAAGLPVRAQYTANYQTNIISGVTSNWTGNYYVGNSTFADVLLIRNSGDDELDIGYAGAGNSLVINNGGQMVSGYRDGYDGSGDWAPGIMVHWFPYKDAPT
jgi:hypothetical protein